MNPVVTKLNFNAVIYVLQVVIVNYVLNNHHKYEVRMQSSP